MRRKFEVVAAPPSVESWDLEEAVSENDLAEAERLLARLIVRSWASRQAAESSRGSQNPLDIRAPMSPHVVGHG